MSSKQGNLTSDDLLARVDEMSVSQKEIMDLVRKREDFRQAKSAVTGSGRAKKQQSPFQTDGDFFKAVMACATHDGSNWGAHPLMKQWVDQANHAAKAFPSGMNETVAADGGVLVPPEVSERIFMRVYDNPLLGLTSMLPVGNSNILRVPTVDETSRADGQRFGGVTSYWEGEEDDATLSKGKLKMLDFRVNRVTAAVRATDELLADSGGAAEAFINLVVPMELKFRIGQALVRGDSVNKPEGILNSPSKITVSKETGQPAASLVTANVNKMWARLYPECEENAIWLCDRSIFPALDTMTIGTAGAQMAVYLPPGGLSASRYGSIKGRPVISVEFCSQLGTVGDLILVDPSTILSVAKGGLMSAVSMHVYFLAHSQVFRFSLRFDAKSWWRTSLTPHSAGDTLSNIVVLQTRS